MTIMNQLKSGIRYLDIRITIDMDDKNKLFLSHEGYVCNNLYGDKLYLYDVIETCVEFLKIHKKETIILHLKNESNDYKEMEKRINKEDSCNYIIGKLIADVLNENKDFKNYIYISNEIPKLNDVEKKIVIVSRSPFTYGDGIPTPFSDGIYFSGKYTLGIYIPVFSLHDCFNYNKKGNKDDVNCHPTIYENFHFQDAYNLNCYEKWILVHDDLTNNVNYKIFAKYNKKGDPVFNDLEYNNDIFNNNSYSDVLSINFMNVARVSGDIIDKAVKYFADSTIEHSSRYINTELTNYIINSYNIHNEWIALDYPSLDVIRSIYRTNDPDNKYYNKYKIKVNKDIILYEINKYYIAQKSFMSKVFVSGDEKLVEPIYKVAVTVSENTIVIAEKVKEVAENFISSFKRYFSKRSEQLNENDVRICLQRELINNKELITIGSDCIKSPKNQWYIVKNNEFYNIVSVYDNKCLIYENNSLSLTECDENNENIDFSIYKGVICSRVDIYK
eukprot:jgi/Orpsp1_1/1188036/evm.model.d7180000062034.1